MTSPLLLPLFLASSSGGGVVYCRRLQKMSPSENIKTVAKMKILQSKEKVVLAEKIAVQAQLEPLQERAEHMVMDIDASKSRVDNIGLEGGEILKPPVTAQMVESMAEKRNQAQDQCQQETQMYEALAHAVKYAGFNE
jgi:hypothetical protein